MSAQLTRVIPCKKKEVFFAKIKRPSKLGSSKYYGRTSATWTKCRAPNFVRRIRRSGNDIGQKKGGTLTEGNQPQGVGKKLGE